MHSSVIGKIEKANRYVHEPERIQLEHLGASFRGDNSSYRVTLEPTGWQCTCHSFESLHGCAHILALQKMLGAMLPEAAQVSLFAAQAAAVEAAPVEAAPV
jgi:hypothetical protein